MPQNGVSQLAEASTKSTNALTHVHWPTSFLGLAIGLLLSFGVLSGDSQGRVNLLFLLVIFVAIPLLSLIVAAITFLMGKSINLARLLASLSSKLGGHLKPQQVSLWPRLNKDWFFLQSQFAAISYALGSIFGLLFLLLFSDINFVWRSTILKPEDLLPILEVIALPWWFWESAQPDYAILQATQDSRITSNSESPAVFAYWWPFVIATQLFYSFGLRLFTLLITRQLIIRKVIKLSATQHAMKDQANQLVPEPCYTKAQVTRELPGNVVLINWGGFEPKVIQYIETYIPGFEVLAAGPLATDEQQSQAEQESRSQVVLVKSWEPPLGELSDYLQKTHGWLMPIDIKHHQLSSPSEIHLDEWCRFAAEQPNWGIFLPQSLQVS